MLAEAEQAEPLVMQAQAIVHLIFKTRRGLAPAVRPLIGDLLSTR